ncbi:sister chromatid cohesion 1 protein 1-like [Trifolium pratense]|uniref:Sister chromatid cohesion 1 protein 1-like n=1 Tax=Trifolium pratense TaxID=57577 RepID=A0A2K3P174_TRIPR|nr:sister chromatid cohesion 1 protein 1-like [Trifolium pratense]
MLSRVVYPFPFPLLACTVFGGMAATMHAKINRRKLSKLNIIKICEEILNPAIPMALRLSGILMGGVVIVYERKVKMLYDDVSRLLVEINEAWKVKSAPEADPTMLPKRKSQAKRAAITLPDKERMTLEEIEQSLQSNATTTMGFQHNAYFSMRLDTMEEPDIGNAGREEEDLGNNHHQAAPEDITIPDSYQANTDNPNRFDRFDNEGDDETQVNVTSGNYGQLPSVLIPSPPPPDDPMRDDIMEDQHPEPPIIPQNNDTMNAREEPQRRRPTKRKRGKLMVMDCGQTVITASTYQSWLKNPSALVSKRGGMNKLQRRHDMMSSTKRANPWEMPLSVLKDGLFSIVNKNIYYPAPLLDLSIESTQPPLDSPSVRISSQNPSEPSSTSLPGVHNNDFAGYGFEETDGRLDNLFNAPVEKARTQILDNGVRVPYATPQTSSGKFDGFQGGDNAYSIPSTVSGHGLSSHSDLERGRLTKKTRRSSSGNSSGGLHTVAENENFTDANFKLHRLSDIGPTPDHELHVETGPTQTQGKANHRSDELTESIHVQMKTFFDTPGGPQFESLYVLATGMTRKLAALLFYQTCVLATRDVLRVEQMEPYGDIIISRGSKM